MYGSFLVVCLVLQDEFLEEQLYLCYSDQVLEQLVLFAFVACPHLSSLIGSSHSMLLLIASSSFVSYRWYPTSHGMLVRSEIEQALFIPPFLGASPDWGRQCIPR